MSQQSPRKQLETPPKSDTSAIKPIAKKKHLFLGSTLPPVNTVETPRPISNAMPAQHYRTGSFTSRSYQSNNLGFKTSRNETKRAFLIDPEEIRTPKVSMKVISFPIFGRE